MAQPFVQQEASDRPVLRRVLVVGCGGSGGNTLAYMMDQLRSDLAAHGIRKIPVGWQFVFIDAPLAEQNAPSGVKKISSEQGVGAYAPVGYAGPYQRVHNAVVDALRSKAPEKLGLLASWADREPNLVTTPVSEGAGQYRAIGRMLVLSRAQQIQQQLEGAWSRLQSSEAHSTLEQLGWMGGYDRNNAPIVLVVGSMAGGSGASMVLDVCRILATIGGVQPALTGVFAVTPDLFTSLPADQRLGVKANSLAMLGEVTAAQSGAAAITDDDVLVALGQGRSVVPQPFARIFPVGLYAGIEGTCFGDGTPGPVYRGLARGLAGLITSPKALQQYIAYDLGNTQGWTMQSMEPFGWGVDMDSLSWGSFGFASLSMGRERYMEYAAQRIARAAVDRLEKGHEIPGSTDGGNAQIQKRIEDTWQWLCGTVMGLPLTMQGVGNWLGQAWPYQQVEQIATGTSSQLFASMASPEGQPGSQWVAMFTNQVAGMEEWVRGTLSTAAYRWAFDWAPQELFPRIINAVEWGISNFGLPFAGALVDRLRAHIETVLVPGIRALAETPLSTASTPDNHVLQQLSQMKTAVNVGGQYERLRVSVAEGHKTFMWVEQCKLLLPIFNELSAQVCAPMSDELRSKLRVTEQATHATGRVAGLAQLSSDHYPDWPSDAEFKPNERWDEATNEVLLMNSKSYLQRYDVDLPASVEGARDLNHARELVIAQVLAGRWKTTGGVQPPGGLIQVTQQWIPQALKWDPHDRSRLVSPSQARFEIHTRPQEVLERAKQFVNRPSESFRQFADKSLRAYAIEAINAYQMDPAPLRDLQAKFREALTRALPLTQLDATLIQALYASKDVKYRFKFSSVPFKDLPLADGLLTIINADQNIDRDVVARNYLDALSTSESDKRIDIFGSYPNLVPLVYKSLLAPIAQQWQQQSGAQERATFWSKRRARPLPAALPMGEDERRAMVAGWYVGLITGYLSCPQTNGRQTNEVPKVYDAANRRWISFPNPLLTPWTSFPSSLGAAKIGRNIIDVDWLPAVLESSLLSIMSVGQTPILASRAPYIALRRLFDSAPNRPTEGAAIINAQELFEGWLGNWPGGNAPQGGQSRVAGETIEEKAANARQYLTSVRTSMIALFRDGEFGVIADQSMLSATPLMRDLSEDVIWACDRLLPLLDPAEAEALRRGAAPTAPTTPAPTDLVF